jgi:UDP-glucuronate 4-epimerase
VTGAAGFIGFHTVSRLLQQGWTVLGIDNFSAYYDVDLKEARAAILGNNQGFAMERLDITNAQTFGEAWRAFKPDVVIHLAAQAGVRYSIDHPEAYVSANIVGTFNVLELARHNPVQHLLAASTSSAYGANTQMPFKETDRAVHPMTLYAATKAASELMGHSYAHLFHTPTTFFRFFTVYGPWGRPDMAYFKFARAILAGQPIDVYNNGEMFRDFTYVDDLVEAVVRLIDAAPGTVPVAEDNLSPVAPFRVVNIGGGAPVRLIDYITALEKALDTQAIKNMMPMQIGDVAATDASATLLRNLISYVPDTPVSAGMQRFVEWYRQYYEV